ncbi:MAG: PepSY-associated TM helix domain-containing protein [Acidobacteriota bacterium]
MSTPTSEVVNQKATARMPRGEATPWANFKRGALKWSRTLHIYLSLSAFAMLLFFAVTGVMLTHDNFGMGLPITTTAEHKLAASITRSHDQKAVVEAVRSAFGITLPMTQFTDDADQMEVSFAGPSKHTQVVIHRDTGVAEGSFENRGLVGILADLHKGAETGWAWRAVLDIVSVWIALSSITGFIMLLALPKRRQLGLIITVIGTLITLAAYVVYVPR